MNREEYLVMLNNRELNISCFHDYYTIFNIKENMKFSLEQFLPLFQTYINMIGIGNIVQKVRQYYEQKFNIIIVLDKNEKEIYYY